MALTVELAVPSGVTLAVPVSFDFQTMDLNAGIECIYDRLSILLAVSVPVT